LEFVSSVSPVFSVSLFLVWFLGDRALFRSAKLLLDNSLIYNAIAMRCHDGN